MLKKEKELMLFGLPAEGRSFEGLFLFLFVYIGASVFAALLTGPVYNIVLFLDSNWSCGATRWLAGYEVDTYYDRLRWISIILGLPWMMRRCSLFSLRNIGLPINPPSLFVFLYCFIFGLCLAVSIYSLQCAFGIFEFKPGLSPAEMVKILIVALSGAILVAFLEELVFRCLIMRSLYTAFGPVSAAILTSLFFAYKHFKVPDNVVRGLLPGGAHSPELDVGWYVAYYDTIGISFDFNLAVFLGLFMFGMLLAAIYIKTKVLWGPIALHAGLVFAMLSYGKLFSKTPGPDSVWLGGGMMTDGWLASIVLCAAFVVLLFWRRGKSV